MASHSTTDHSTQQQQLFHFSRSGREAATLGSADQLEKIKRQIEEHRNGLPPQHAVEFINKELQEHRKVEIAPREDAVNASFVELEKLTREVLGPDAGPDEWRKSFGGRLLLNDQELHYMSGKGSELFNRPDAAHLTVESKTRLQKTWGTTLKTLFAQQSSLADALHYHKPTPKIMHHLTMHGRYAAHIDGACRFLHEHLLLKDALDAKAGEHHDEKSAQKDIEHAGERVRTAFEELDVELGKLHCGDEKHRFGPMKPRKDHRHPLKGQITKHVITKHSIHRLHESTLELAQHHFTMSSEPYRHQIIENLDTKVHHETNIWETWIRKESSIFDKVKQQINGTLQERLRHGIPMAELHNFSHELMTQLKGYFLPTQPSTKSAIDKWFNAYKYWFQKDHMKTMSDLISALIKSHEDPTRPLPEEYEFIRVDLNEQILGLCDIACHRHLTLRHIHDGILQYRSTSPGHGCGHGHTGGSHDSGHGHLGSSHASNVGHADQSQGSTQEHTDRLREELRQAQDKFLHQYKEVSDRLEELGCGRCDPVGPTEHVHAHRQIEHVQEAARHALRQKLWEASPGGRAPPTGHTDSTSTQLAKREAFVKEREEIEAAEEKDREDQDQARQKRERKRTEERERESDNNKKQALAVRVKEMERRVQPSTSARMREEAEKKKKRGANPFSSGGPSR